MISRVTDIQVVSEEWKYVRKLSISSTVDIMTLGVIRCAWFRFWEARRIPDPCCKNQHNRPAVAGFDLDIPQNDCRKHNQYKIRCRIHHTSCV